MGRRLLGDVGGRVLVSVFGEVIMTRRRGFVQHGINRVPRPRAARSRPGPERLLPGRWRRGRGVKGRGNRSPLGIGNRGGGASGRGEGKGSRGVISAAARSLLE